VESSITFGDAFPQLFGKTEQLVGIGLRVIDERQRYQAYTSVERLLQNRGVDRIGVHNGNLPTRRRLGKRSTFVPKSSLPERFPP
jgi:hypothetical protein